MLFNLIPETSVIYTYFLRKNQVKNSNKKNGQLFNSLPCEIGYRINGMLHWIIVQYHHAP